MRRALEHWPIKLTALLLAAVLWAMVAAETATTQLLRVNLRITPPPGRTLARPPLPVNVVLAGPARELLKVYGNPPLIHRAIPDTVSDSVYVLHLSPADVELPRNATVRTQDLQPRTMTVALTPLASAGRADAAPPERPNDSSGGSLSDRVLMGVPVTVQGSGGGWVSEPPAVIVTVRGPSARLMQLTRDSVQVAAAPAGGGTPETVRLEVMAPSGILGSATPDTARVLRRARG